jgi:fructose-bisphosphate aldolase class I
VLCQEGGLVPIVEPEVLNDGDHTIDVCDDVTAAVLEAVFDQLFEHRVQLEGILLKPNMVLAGKSCPVPASVDEVAGRTLRCFRWSVPAAVPGIVFLSGGQSDELATAHLDAMNKRKSAGEIAPWEISFSYGRALQGPALRAWKGEPANVNAGRAAFAHRASLNGAARVGAYTSSMEQGQ